MNFDTFGTDLVFSNNAVSFFHFFFIFFFLYNSPEGSSPNDVRFYSSISFDISVSCFSPLYDFYYLERVFFYYFFFIIFFIIYFLFNSNLKYFNFENWYLTQPSNTTSFRSLILLFYNFYYFIILLFYYFNFLTF
jgi:hypothetical protein